MTADRHALDDAAYVLGALSPAERQAFERHLLDCAACRASVQRLAGLPGLLADTDPAALFPAAADGSSPHPNPAADLLADAAAGAPSELADEDLEPPSTLLPALLAQTRREQHRRRTSGIAALAVAAACALVLAGITWWAPSQHGNVAGPPVATGTPTTGADQRTGPQPMRQVVSGPMSASVQLTDTAWGTKIDVHCHYQEVAGGSGSGYVSSPYVLVVTDRKGNRQQAGAWLGTPGRSASVQAATSLRPDQIAALEIDSSTGSPILRLRR